MLYFTMASVSVSLVEFYRKLANEEQKFYLSQLFKAAKDEKEAIRSLRTSQFTLGTAAESQIHVNYQNAQKTIGSCLVRLEELGLGHLVGVQQGLLHYRGYAGHDIPQYAKAKSNSRK